MIPWLNPNDPFPPLDSALREPNGLLAAGGDLSPQRLIDAHSRGIFPWFNPGEPVLWWSPNPRMVLFPNELKVSRSLRKTLKRHTYEVRADTAFRQVMEACAAPRDGHSGTWITPAMIAAYTELHRQSLAHSVETWMDDQLVGGLYGVSLGRMFYGESMFSLATDASKIAFVHLVRQLERWGFGMIDCQMKTAHLASLGAREIPRAEFSQKLSELVNFPGINGAWRFDHELAE
ncbi:MAG: leucyl/phenylalanyl-tRNA--protein transferase [Hydrogenophilales bacterium CG_4_9_14_3_um_filter_59_35]|nr:MAG: leucyl/phenylalanyl-tRNA--protein transferase [Hydrogenophilales bacterium CG_4_10_14_3_um_filter_58_23]PJB07812.1 MAG: leucyl/phenylalanyl-tRNA--protein transferase [Hydrogenophilales bacterium CG_4_9_14_3_um_filter_59_35]